MPSIEEQEMRDYLLGSLSPQREAELKLRLGDDADLKEQLLAVEAELCDQYLAGSLSVDEQQGFERRVLSVDGGQEKLHFAQIFAKYRNNHLLEESLDIDRVPAPNTPVPASSPLFATFYKNPAFAVLMIVVVSLVTLLFAWTSRVESPQTNIVRPAETSLPRELTLTPGSLRSGGGLQHLKAPPKNVHVTILLEIAKSDFRKYKTQLFRENQALESQEQLTTEARNAHYVVPVTFTGEVLTPGDYELKLCGVAESGSPTFINNYAFRVTPENSPQASDSESRRDEQAR